MGQAQEKSSQNNGNGYILLFRQLLAEAKGCDQVKEEVGNNKSPYSQGCKSG